MSIAALRSAWPALLLATLILTPFLNSPFTIDDPIYLLEAQHTITDPLHPQAFSLVWSFYQNLRASEILPGGVAYPYMLVPTALLGSKEWAGHLTTLVFLLIALWSSAALALRLGLDQAQARWVALLTASGPAVLGMAGTVMPDIAAMLAVVAGMERTLAWRDDRKWQQALLATAWFALAVLTRTHTILVLAAAAVLLLDGITVDALKASVTRFPARFAPLVLAPLLAFAVTRLTADPQPSGETLLDAVVTQRIVLHTLGRNILAYLAHFVFVVPLTIPWLLVRWRRASRVMAIVCFAVAVIVSLEFGWAAYAAALTGLVLLDILSDALVRRDRVQLALWLWLLMPIPVSIYFHLPAKYLLPAAPAVAILVVRLRPDRRVLPALAAAGAVLGVLILLGSRDLAEVQRRAAAELITPHKNLYERVWYMGHWGFHWYAEAAGAKSGTMGMPEVRPGDIVVMSFIDEPPYDPKVPSREVLQNVTYPSRFGLVMDKGRGAGFFSNGWGYLPWVPGQGTSNRFEVWRIQ